MRYDGFGPETCRKVSNRIQGSCRAADLKSMPQPDKPGQSLTTPEKTA